MNEIHSVDRHVGQRTRELRVKAGLSQQAVAKDLGLTFQQVQKYEKGTNRISASKLFELSRILSCQVQDFFTGLDQAGSDRSPIGNPSKVDYEILALLGRLSDGAVKQGIRGLLRSLHSMSD